MSFQLDGGSILGIGLAAFCLENAKELQIKVLGLLWSLGLVPKIDDLPIIL